MDGGAWLATVHGVAESDMTLRLNHTTISSEIMKIIEHHLQLCITSNTEEKFNKNVHLYTENYKFSLREIK